METQVTVGNLKKVYTRPSKILWNNKWYGGIDWNGIKDNEHGIWAREDGTSLGSVFIPDTAMVSYGAREKTLG